MVTGYLMVRYAHRRDARVAALATEPDAVPPAPGRTIGHNDIAIERGGKPVEAVVRFHNVLRELRGRGIRDDVSRYGSLALALVDPAGTAAGTLIKGYPTEASPLRAERFFETLYLRYNERYVYSAPDLKAVTHRREWASGSPSVGESHRPLVPQALDYQVRVA